ncbi:unnamed protein product, partial [Ixodes persulcatus]
WPTRRKTVKVRTVSTAFGCDVVRCKLHLYPQGERERGEPARCAWGPPWRHRACAPPEVPDGRPPLPQFPHLALLLAEGAGAGLPGDPLPGHLHPGGDRHEDRPHRGTSPGE